MKNIIDTAIGNKDFSILVSAIKAADLADTLSGSGPFTVFAPNNDAFAKIPDATMKEVLGDKKKLTSILTYHVIPGKLMLKDITTTKEEKTLEGSKVAISAKDGTLINNSKITHADIECSNGVIHVIDTVLMP